MNSQLNMVLISPPYSSPANISKRTRRSNKTKITVVVRRWRYGRGGYKMGLELVYTKEFHKIMKLIGRHPGKVTATVKNVEYMADHIQDGTPYDVMNVVLS